MGVYMKKVLRFGLLLCLGVILISTVEAKSKKKAEYTIVIDQSLYGNSEKKSLALASWFSYAGIINSDLEVFSKENPGTEYIRSYETELKARKHMIDSYQQMFTNMKLQETDKDEYLEEVKKISDSGFIQEYVFYSFNKYNWQVPEGLREKDYQEWMQSNLPNHQPQTLADVRKGE